MRNLLIKPLRIRAYKVEEDTYLKLTSGKYQHKCYEDQLQLINGDYADSLCLKAEQLRGKVKRVD